MEIFSYVGGSTAPKLNTNTPTQEKDSYKIAVESVIARNTIRMVLFCVPVVLFMIYSSYMTVQFCNKISSFASPVHFRAFSVNEKDILDSAMFHFSLEQQVFTDSDGNIVDAQGNALLPQELFKDPVTYKTYTVKNGDTIGSICKKSGLSNISTLIALNKISNVRTVKAGQKLKIPSIDGLIHTVSKGDTLASISAKYSCAVEDILDVNELFSKDLKVNQELFIPGARMDNTSLRQALGELFIMPLTTKFRYTSMFGKRDDPITGVKSYHTGVDMACPTGTPIRASMGGTVALTSYSNIYGNYVIINHGNGYQTLYGHMSKKVAKGGQEVAQGDIIGYVGSTGYSTGPHLHFTVYKNSTLMDPMSVLKQK